MVYSHIDEGLFCGRMCGLSRIVRAAVRGIISVLLGRRQRKPKEDSATLDQSAGLSALSGDEVRNIFWHACNPLEPHVAVAFSSTSHELWALTQAMRLQLRSNHEAVATLCRKAGKRYGKFSQLQRCKKLREARRIEFGGWNGDLSAAELAMIGTLGPVLPVLEQMQLSGQRYFGRDIHGTLREIQCQLAADDGVQRLVAGLGAGALPAMTTLAIYNLHVGDAGASALAAALDRGALPRLENLTLCKAAIGDLGLVALAPALRLLPALKELYLMSNLFGDEGLAALVAPPPPLAGALLPPKGGLLKLKKLDLVGDYTQITDAGCAALISAFGSGTLPALEKLVLRGIPASAAAQTAVQTGRSDVDLLSPEQVQLFEQLVGSNN